MKKLLSFCVFAFAMLSCSFCTIFSSKVNACDICDEINVFCSAEADEKSEDFYCAEVQHTKDRRSAKLLDKGIDDVISVSISTKSGYSEVINFGICKGSVRYLTLGVMRKFTNVHESKMLGYMYGESYILFAKIFKNLVEACPKIRNARFVRMYKNKKFTSPSEYKLKNYEYEIFLSMFKIISGFGKSEGCMSFPLEDRGEGVRAVSFCFKDYKPVFPKARFIQNLERR